MLPSLVVETCAKSRTYLTPSTDAGEASPPRSSRGRGGRRGRGHRRDPGRPRSPKRSTRDAALVRVGLGGGGKGPGTVERWLTVTPDFKLCSEGPEGLRLWRQSGEERSAGIGDRRSNESSSTWHKGGVSGRRTPGPSSPARALQRKWTSRRTPQTSRGDRGSGSQVCAARGRKPPIRWLSGTLGVYVHVRPMGAGSGVVAVLVHGFKRKNRRMSELSTLSRCLELQTASLQGAVETFHPE